MFDAIADRYDLMNKVMTFGQDRRWRDFVVSRGGDVGSGWVLDLACGTGEIAAQFNRSNPEARVAGADFSSNMLSRASAEQSAAGIEFQACDANQLPYRDGVFEAVSFGYLLRNVDDSLTVLKEGVIPPDAASWQTNSQSPFEQAQKTADESNKAQTVEDVPGASPSDIPYACRIHIPGTTHAWRALADPGKPWREPTPPK